MPDAAPPRSSDTASGHAPHQPQQRPKHGHIQRRKPPLRVQPTTLWEYPSQDYGDAHQGVPGYKGATPSYIIWNLLQRYTKPNDLVIDPCHDDRRGWQNQLLDAFGTASHDFTAFALQSLGNALNFQGDVWTTGLVFSVPIGNGAARTTLAQAKIEHDRVGQELAQTERGVELQVRATMIKLRTDLERIRARAAELEQSKGKLEQAEARFARGSGSSLDVTGVRDKLLAAKTDLLKSVVDYDVGLAELEAVLGGSI